ncbi:MAG TPA: hypothetical protein DCM71_27260, partial [Runella sp.]|nr:hypothetical protein [Runella sp.]
MPKTNLVTVIICTWNRSQLLETTLDSLAHQIVSPEHDFEVIVVDNNSEDNTKAVVEKFSNKLANKNIQ